MIHDKEWLEKCVSNVDVPEASSSLSLFRLEINWAMQIPCINWKQFRSCALMHMGACCETWPHQALNKCWNTCVKLCYNVPRSTFTDLIEDYRAADVAPFRNQVLARYAGFYRGLLSSPSREIRAMTRIVSDDPRSSTCRNLRLLRQVTGLSQPHLLSNYRMKAPLPVKSGELETWSSDNFTQSEGRDTQVA